MLNTKLLGSVSAAPGEYIDDVFSTYLYTGDGGLQTITNGIDLAGEGGLVWCKGRSGTYGAVNHVLADTARGAKKLLFSNTTGAQVSEDDIYSFTSTGFQVVDTANRYANGGSTNYCSWTFRKAPKFFDVVTWSGNSTNRTISHNLGSVPGMIIIKRTDATGAWQVYHRSLANTEYLVLNTTAAKATGATRWNSTTPTSSVFSLGTDATVNASGGTYVAYLFAHDAGGFGAAGTDNVISCGSFTGGTTLDVNLGYEAQYVLMKGTSSGDWMVFDVMRGMSLTSGKVLYPNLSSAEDSVSSLTVAPTATGFTVNPAALYGNQTYIYMAIRRPMKPPTSGTQVFSPNTETSSTSPQTVTTGFPVDLCINTLRNGGFASTPVMDRLRGGTTTSYNFLTTTTTAAEATGTGAGLGFDSNIGLIDNAWLTNTNAILWNFRRATGFFDVVCYTGTGGVRTVAHNLGAVPELMIVKKRDSAIGNFGWAVWHTSFTTTNQFLELQTSDPIGGSNAFNSTPPTASVFTTGDNIYTNLSGSPYVAYLFATLAGVSKVGSYTGNGSSQTINCGFTAGARFVLIKRTDASGDWVVIDTARGIVSGNDPFLQLNSTAAEVTGEDIVDPVNSGFIVNSTTENINASGGTYIYLAIA